MSRELVVFLVGAPPCFGLGWLARGWWDYRGNVMKGTNVFDRIFDWFGHGNRLVAFTLVVGLIGLGAFGYTWNADQQSEDRTDLVVRCIAEYVNEQNAAQMPRTEASTRATDARFAWDQAQPGPQKERLREAYVAAYQHYVEVRVGNPYPAFSLSYCERRQ